MARLNARLKCNYYPLPDAEAIAIRERLVYPPGASCSALDPCAGEGRALSIIADTAHVRRYGIELDAYRAEEAQQRLDSVLQGDCLSAQAKFESFSLLYCNPPYDTEQGTGGNHRLEALFLAHTARWLVPRGVLVLVIPVGSVPDCSRTLAACFTNIRVVRLTSLDAERYKQVVVFGVARSRKERERVRDSEITGARSWIAGVAWTYAKLPTFDTEPFRYSVPPSLPADIAYQGIPLDEVEDLLPRSAATRQMARFLQPEAAELKSRPLISLHKGHVGLLACGGLVDGCFGRGDRLHIAAWKSKKVTHKTEETEDGVTTIREREQYVHEVAIAFASGETAILD